MWKFCEHTLLRGEKKRVYLNSTGCERHKIPATLIYGSNEGKTVCINAGTHSGEYPGISASISIANKINPKEVSGKIIFIHCLNTAGFWERSLDVIPEDGTNLDRAYPGRKDGSIGEQIQDFVVTNIFPHLDFLLDLHSGSKIEKLANCLFFPNTADKDVREEALNAAYSLNIPWLIASSSQGGQYGYASKLSIPALLLERSGFGENRQEDVMAYENDILLLLNHLQIFKTEKNKVCEKTIFTKNVYLNSICDGLWYPAISAGEKIKEGQFLGEQRDFFGNILNKYYATQDGFVFYFTDGLSVSKDMPLVAYGI